MIRDRAFWGLCSIALAIGAGPTVVGWLLTPHGYQFLGNSALNPFDYHVYYNYITQAQQGHFFMRDLLTNEHLPATLWQPFWWLVGTVGLMFHLGPVGALFAARLAGIVVFVLTLWWAAGKVFFERHTRITAASLALFAGGLGGLLLPWTMRPELTRWPDLWVSEAFPVLTLMSSPHFLFVTSGILYVLISMERFNERSTRRQEILMWLVAAAVLVIHPFHILTWGLLWASLTAWRRIRSGHWPWPYVVRWVRLCLVVSPILALYFLQLAFDPITWWRASQNINLTWPWWKTIITLIPLGALFAWKRKATPIESSKKQWLIAWGAVILVTMYIPLSFQRRLSQGLLIPFAFLAAPAAWQAWQWCRRQSWRGGLVVGALGLMLFGTGLRVASTIINEYGDEISTGTIRPFYLSPEYLSVSKYLQQQGRHDQTMLSSYTISLVLSGLSGQRVYVAHQVETVNFLTKRQLMQRFYGSMTLAQQYQFVQQTGVCYILDSYRERSYGSAFYPDAWPNLQPVWHSADATLYYLSTCS